MKNLILNLFLSFILFFSYHEQLEARSKKNSQYRTVANINSKSSTSKKFKRNKKSKAFNKKKNKRHKNRKHSLNGPDLRELTSGDPYAELSTETGIKKDIESVQNL